MRSAMGAVLVALLALPAVRGEDKPKAPSTPQEQYGALMKEFQQAQQAVFKAMSQAKSPQESQKAMGEMRSLSSKYAPKFLELAQKHPKDPVALDALIFVLNNSRGAPAESTKAILAILAKDYLESEKIGRVCQGLASPFEKAKLDFLKTVIEKNPHQSVQMEASLALAQSLRQRAMIAVRIKDGNLQLSKQLEEFVGKDAVEDLKNSDIAKVEAEEAELYRNIADKYLDDIPAQRATMMCQQLSMMAGKSGESFLRTVLEKDKRREVQGVACLALAQALKQRADDTFEKDAKESAKLRGEAEKLFERAVDKFGDVKTAFRGAVADSAKSELYEIRHLSIGMTAPDVEGKDQDGKKFKLSDYKGKVVLLDFWSEF